MCGPAWASLFRDPDSVPQTNDSGEPNIVIFLVDRCVCCETDPEGVVKFFLHLIKQPASTSASSAFKLVGLTGTLGGHLCTRRLGYKIRKDEVSDV